MPGPFVTSDAVRAYAAGERGWATLRERGVPYQDVLAGLGALALRPPRNPMTRSNIEARQRGRRQSSAALAAARS